MCPCIGLASSPRCKTWLEYQSESTTPMGSFIFHITAALAELERSNIRERTRAGLTAARARGRNGGRPKKLNDREWRAIRTLVDARELTIEEIAGQYGVSRATIYRRASVGSNPSSRFSHRGLSQALVAASRPPCKAGGNFVDCDG